MRKKNFHWATCRSSTVFGRFLAQNPTSQANVGNLPQPNQLLSPVLSTSRSDASTHGLKSREVSYLPTQLLGVSAYRPFKRAPLLPQFSGGEHINFTVPPPNQLLNPFLSTSRSGEFRTDLTNEKSVCLPTQILH